MVTILANTYITPIKVLMTILTKSHDPPSIYCIQTTKLHKALYM